MVLSVTPFTPCLWFVARLPASSMRSSRFSRSYSNPRTARPARHRPCPALGDPHWPSYRPRPSINAHRRRSRRPSSQSGRARAQTGWRTSSRKGVSCRLSASYDDGRTAIGPIGGAQRYRHCLHPAGKCPQPMTRQPSSTPPAQCVPNPRDIPASSLVPFPLPPRCSGSLVGSHNFDLSTRIPRRADCPEAAHHHNPPKGGMCKRHSLALPHLRAFALTRRAATIPPASRPVRTSPWPLDSTPPPHHAPAASPSSNCWWSW
jgi:hypothetical protein